MKSISSCFIISLFVLIYCIGSLSAQTPVMGKIYNSDYSDVISGASVIIYCGSNFLNTTSLSDGAYIVEFASEICNYPDYTNIRVEAKKDNLIGSNLGNLIECNDNNCTGDYFSVVNINLTVQITSGGPSSSSSGGGGSYRGYFNCGNNKCDTGETEKTCAKDCANISLKNSIVNLSLLETSNINSNATSDENVTIQEENKKTNSGILGAVMGVGTNLKNFQTILIIVFAVGIVMATLIISVKKRKSKNKARSFIDLE